MCYVIGLYLSFMGGDDYMTVQKKTPMQAHWSFLNTDKTQSESFVLGFSLQVLFNNHLSADYFIATHSHQV